MPDVFVVGGRAPSGGGADLDRFARPTQAGKSGGQKMSAG